MKVLFLCGGVGKRMFPIVEDKFLLKFLGKTVLEYQIEQAMKVGLNEFIIVVNPQNREEVERISRGISDANVEVAVQEEPLGIANALESSEHLLSKDIIVVNPNDIFQSSAYKSLLQMPKNGSDFSCMLGYEVRDYFPGGYLVIDSENSLMQIIEKPVQGEEPSNLVNILVHYHSDITKIMGLVKTVKTERDDVYESALDTSIKNGYRIKVIPYRGFWSAIKYPWHILTMVKYFLDESERFIAPSAKISSSATIEGKVIIGDNVRVLENAIIRGPAYIGANTVIGNNALVRDYCHIGADCVVGYCTEVKTSYIGDRCWFHSNYIGDSIIDEGCSFGSGTVLANFRFDEKNVSVRIGSELVDTGLDKLGAIIGRDSKTGINSSILPGVKIGPNSFVGPHVCLTNDLGPNSMISPESSYRITKRKILLDTKKKEELMKKLEKI